MGGSRCAEVCADRGAAAQLRVDGLCEFWAVFQCFRVSVFRLISNVERRFSVQTLLDLSRAMTHHKSQGQQFKFLKIDLRNFLGCRGDRLTRPLRWTHSYFRVVIWVGEGGSSWCSRLSCRGSDVCPLPAFRVVVLAGSGGAYTIFFICS